MSLKISISPQCHSSKFFMTRRGLFIFFNDIRICSKNCHGRSGVALPEKRQNKKKRIRSSLIWGEAQLSNQRCLDAAVLTNLDRYWQTRDEYSLQYKVCRCMLALSKVCIARNCGWSPQALTPKNQLGRSNFIEKLKSLATKQKLNVLSFTDPVCVCVYTHTLLLAILQIQCTVYTRSFISTVP